MLTIYEFFIFIVFFYNFFVTFNFDENLYYVGLVSLFCLPSLGGVFFKEKVSFLAYNFSSVFLASFLDINFYCSKIFKNIIGVFFLELFFFNCFLSFCFFYFSYFISLQNNVIVENIKKIKI